MHRLLYVIALSLVAAHPGWSAAQSPDTSAKVSATGQVIVRLVPTRAVSYLLVEATAPTPAEAVSRGALSSSAVLDTLRRAGGALDITVVQYGVVPTPANYSGGGGGPPNTFTSREAVRFVSALSRIQDLTAAAYAKGASGSAPPQFQHEEFNAAVTAALEEASAMARTRAASVARGLGGTLGVLSGITAGYYGGDYSATPAYFPMPQQFDHQSRPLPEIRHTVQVTGTWRFVQR